MARNARTESPDSAERNGSEGKDKKPKSRRPANTAFRQQRLKAWQPILTPKTVLPLFFVVGIIFAPLGGLMLYASAQVSQRRKPPAGQVPTESVVEGSMAAADHMQVEQLVIDYSTCTQPPGQGGAPVTNNPSNVQNLADIPSGNVQQNFKSNGAGLQNPQWVQWSQTVQYYMGKPVTSVSNGQVAAKVQTPMCSLFFEIPDDIGYPTSPVLLYYRLTNFYQNHRRYVKSFDSTQLSGPSAPNAAAIQGSSCDPLTVNGSRPYYPCGVVANSQFNDTFSSPVALNAAGAQDAVPYNMTNIGIAWASDSALYSAKCQYTDLSSIAVPPFWEARWPNGVYSASNPPPSLQQYEEFQVWMRTAGLPNFSKLALRNDNETMKAGRYRLDIGMNFPVLEYDGTKSIVISTSTVIGGKNPFLGIAYVVVAGLCVLLGLAFTAAQLIKPRKLGDHTHLSWNNEQPATGASTGVQRAS